MDMFEKVDKLRERANVSYEEAKEALERANGDILDAMILLEREGKTRKEGSESYVTDRSTESRYYESCPADDPKKARKERVRQTGRTFGEKLKSLFQKSLVNYLVVDRKGETLLKLPILAVVVIILVAWYAAIVAIVVSLFCECRYRFVGEDDLKAVNDVCEKVEDLASQVKDKAVEGYNKTKNGSEEE